MDTVRLNHLGLNGPGIWYLLHHYGRRAIDDITKDHFEYLVQIIGEILNCEKCLSHFQDFLKEHPLKSYRNLQSKKGISIGYFKWSWELHNSVNIRLNKKCPTLSIAYQNFIDKKISYCITCDQLQE